MEPHGSTTSIKCEGGVKWLHGGHTWLHGYSTFLLFRQMITQTTEVPILVLVEHTCTVFGAYKITMCEDSLVIKTRNTEIHVPHELLT